MLGMSPAVAAIAGAVVGVVLAVVGRAAEPALVVLLRGRGRVASTRMRRRALSADDRLVANLLVLLNLVTLAWTLFGSGGGLVALAMLGGLGGLGAASAFFARSRHG